MNSWAVGMSTVGGDLNKIGRNCFFKNRLGGFYNFLGLWEKPSSLLKIRHFWVWVIIAQPTILFLFLLSLTCQLKYGQKQSKNVNCNFQPSQFLMHSLLGWDSALQNWRQFNNKSWFCCGKEVGALYTENGETVDHMSKVTGCFKLPNLWWKTTEKFLILLSNDKMTHQEFDKTGWTNWCLQNFPWRCDTPPPARTRTIDFWYFDFRMWHMVG